MVDRLQSVRVVNPAQSYQVVAYLCLSQGITIWVLLLLLHSIVLGLAVVIMAFKTSKIRYKYFGDTKATNAFVYVSQHSD